MKRKLLFTLWLLAPVALLAYHYGPGQAALSRDQAAGLAREAVAAEKAGDWATARERYLQALGALPADAGAERFRVRLAAANARMYLGELPESLQDLDALLTDMGKSGADESDRREVRGTLAGGQYYAAWLMRLENAPTEEWMEQAENARQNFRLLAEETGVGDARVSENHQKNLESVIRLQRMDLSELQGMPLPKKCEGCKNCSQKCRSQKESRNQEAKKGQEKPKDARGATAGQRPDGSGS